MRKCKISNMILNEITKKCPPHDYVRKETSFKKCDGFLCTSEGLCTDQVIKSTHVTYTTKDYITMAITNILLTIGNAQDLLTILLPAIESTGCEWAECFDRRQVSDYKCVHTPFIHFYELINQNFDAKTSLSIIVYLIKQ